MKRHRNINFVLRTLVLYQQQQVRLDWLYSEMSHINLVNVNYINTCNNSNIYVTTIGKR